MHQPHQGNRFGLGLAAGFLMSFFAFGLLWIGTPWPKQFLMCILFFITAYVLSRRGSDGRSVLIGATPIAFLIAQFRDPQGSHTQSILLVAAWAASVLLGWWLARHQGRARAK